MCVCVCVCVEGLRGDESDLRQGWRQEVKTEGAMCSLTLWEHPLNGAQHIPRGTDGGGR